MAGRVLVIDDDADVLRYLGALLRDEGYEVVTASHGKEGLRLARSCRPDAVTLDITMPGMTGVQVFERIRSDPSLKDTPVIVVSGVMEGRRILAGGRGAPPVAYVDKPVDPEKLLAVLRDALRRAGGGKGREA